MIRIQIKFIILSVLIWVQTVCKDYHQMTKSPVADKEVNPRRSFVQVDLDFLNKLSIREKIMKKFSKYEA